MVRTQIQLPEDEYRRLKAAAARQGRSMADCIREGITLFLGRTGSQEQELKEIAGAFRPIPDEGVKDHDREWARAALGRRKRTATTARARSR